MSVRGLAALLLCIGTMVAALAGSARSQPAPASGLSVRPSFPPVVEVGRARVEASLQLGTSSLVPAALVELTVDPGPDGSIVLGSPARGVGPACEGFFFDVTGPDATGRYLFRSTPAVVLTLVVAGTCTVRFTFDVRTGVAGGQVTPVATLTTFPLVAFPIVPALTSTVTGHTVMTVVPAVPSVRVAARSPTAPLGTPVVSDVAVASGPVAQGTPGPTGSVTFRLFGPDDASCASPPVFTSDAVMLEGGVAASPPVAPGRSGEYRWAATYDGDLSYQARRAGCDGDDASITTVLPPTTSGASTTLVPPPTVTPLPSPASPAAPGAASSASPTTVVGPSAPPSAPSPSPAAPSAARSSDRVRPAAYDPAAHAAEVVDRQVGAFVLLTLVLGSAGRAMGRRGAVSGSGSGDDSDGAEGVVSTQVGVSDQGVLTDSRMAPGDRSRTWRWPGTELLDKLSLTAPLWLAKASPLAARVVDDAVYLRAILGAASLIFPLGAVALGVLAVVNVQGEALPPAFGLLMAIAVIGVLDAAAGLLAVAVFVAGVVLLGGLTSPAEARTLLTFALLWFAVPVIAGAARPLLRDPTATMADHWDRLADIVIASLIGAWAVQQLLQALPIISGLDLPDAQRANDAAVIVLATVAARMTVETIAAHWYPDRLSRVAPTARPGSWRGQRLTATVLTLSLFVFVAVSYVGFCWQLYVGATLFVVPQIVGFFDDRLPNLPRLYAALPHGIVQIVLLFFVTGFLGVLVVDRFGDGQELICWSFLLLSLPGFLFAMLDLFGREGPERQLRWRHQVAGTLILAVGVLGVLGIIGF